MLSNLSEGIVLEITRRAVHDQHAACATLGWRLLRDQVFGKIVVEVGNAKVLHLNAFSVVVALLFNDSRQANPRSGAKAHR